MSWTKALFATSKPIIGLLHLCALPSDPFYEGSMTAVIQRAVDDLHALQEGGVDGILITNEFSQPYPQRVSYTTMAAMGRIFGELHPHITVPYGMETIHDTDGCIELCAATDAAFTRCLFSGVWACDLGLFDKDIAQTLRVRRALDRNDLKLCYFISGEGNTPLDTRTLAQRAKSMLFHCKPECLVVPGEQAGSGPDLSHISEVKKVVGDVPVMCGTGFGLENCERILELSDGAFVGSAFKRDNVFENPIDKDRVSRLMETVRRCRKDA